MAATVRNSPAEDRGGAANATPPATISPNQTPAGFRLARKNGGNGVVIVSGVAGEYSSHLAIENTERMAGGGCKKFIEARAIRRGALFQQAARQPSPSLPVVASNNQPQPDTRRFSAGQKKWRTFQGHREWRRR